MGAAGLILPPLEAFSVRENVDLTPEQWQIGCYTRPWDKHDYHIALDAIAEAGFKCVGLMTANSKTGLVISVQTTVEEAGVVGDDCKERGLKIPSVYAGGIPVAESLEAGIQAVKHLIDNCVAAGAANLMMAGVEDKNLQEPYYKAIAESCAYAAEKGIGISVKPHGGLNATGPELRKIIETVGNENLRIWYDPGNIFYYSDGNLDPVDDSTAVDGLVVGMSVKDYLPPKNVFVTPGDGQVDFPRVMENLKKGGFTGGPLVVECLKQGDLSELLREAKRARRFLEKLVGQ